MTQARSETPYEALLTMLTPVTHAGMATFATTPLRVLMNNASEYTNPWQTFKAAAPYFLKGLPINVARGALSSGSQAVVFHEANQLLGERRNAWTSLGVIVASSIAGMCVALGVETPFIRRNMGKPNMFRMTPALPPLYLCREFGFGLIVFLSNDMPPLQHYGLLAVGTVFTAATHKLVTAEVIRDVRVGNEKPDFCKDGFRNTIRNMANGGVYTHPSYAVPYQDNLNLPKRCANLFVSGCGVNMFVFRLLYLWGFKKVYNLAKEHTDPVVSLRGLFARPAARNEAMEESDQTAACKKKM